MGLFDRVERGLERAVNGAFAKAFRAGVEPVEIASAIRRAMDDRAAVLGHGRTMVPNRYTIELSPTDFGRLNEYADPLSEELVAAAQEHAESQRFQPGGPFDIVFAEGADLETGVFRVKPATSRRTMAPAEPGHESAAHPPRPDARNVPAGPSPAQAAVAGAAGAAAAGHVTSVGRVAPPPVGNPARRPWLDIDGERYPLLGAMTVLGRDSSCDVILDDPGISRRHSEIRVTSDGPHLVSSIRDLASTNGTFVNGDRITSQRLVDGDRITVGRTSVTFRAGKR